MRLRRGKKEIRSARDTTRYDTRPEEEEEEEEEQRRRRRGGWCRSGQKGKSMHRMASQPRYTLLLTPGR